MFSLCLSLHRGWGDYIVHWSLASDPFLRRGYRSLWFHVLSQGRGGEGVSQSGPRSGVPPPLARTRTGWGGLSQSGPMSEAPSPPWPGSGQRGGGPVGAPQSGPRSEVRPPPGQDQDGGKGWGYPCQILGQDYPHSLRTVDSTRHG